MEEPEVVAKKFVMVVNSSITELIREKHGRFLQLEIPDFCGSQTRITIVRQSGLFLRNVLACCRHFGCCGSMRD